jgi:hypothetical protein
MPQGTTVTVRFTGLLVFCFDKRRNICQVGVHSSTDDHELRLRLIKRGPDPESESEQTLTLSHAQIRQLSELWLDVEGGPTAERTAERFIIGNLNETPTDPRDYRWIVDMEDLHRHPLRLKEGVLRPIVYVTTGLFYTAELSSEPYLAIPVARTGTKRRRALARSLGRIADVVGANIQLIHPNQALVLKTGRNGPELLRLKREEGVAYEVTVENGDTPQAPPGNDFDYYYHAIELNRGEPKILLEPYGLPSFGGIMSVCSPVGFGMSDGLVGDYD